jgi:hypothetical protein
MRLAMRLAFFVALVGGQTAAAAPHPFNDDAGNVNWRPSVAAALQLAQKTGKPLFIEACKDGDGDCRQMAAGALRDPIVGLTLSRHFVSVAVDKEKAPPELQEVFKRVEGNKLPFLVFLTDKGQYILGISGPRDAKRFQGDLEEVLKGKQVLMSKKNEADLARHVAALQKALDAKDYKKAIAALHGVEQVHGYSAEKDRAYDLMDKAQEEGANVLRKAFDLARKTDLNGAKAVLSDFPAKAMAGLPIAADAKDHQAAFKLLDAATQTMTAKKLPNWKFLTLQQIDTLLGKYPDTPYASLAMSLRRDVMKD